MIQVLFLLPNLVLLLVVAILARGLPRTLGSIGATLMLLSGVSSLVIQFVAIPRASGGNLSPSAIGLLYIPGSILSGVGIILLGLAVVVGSRQQPRFPGPATDAQPSEPARW